MALLFGIACGSQSAFAGRAVCRTDPIVTFADGTKVQLVAALQTDPALVASITYEVHAPKGASIVSIDYADGDPVQENVTLVTDQAAGKYRAKTYATPKPGTPKFHIDYYGWLNSGGQHSAGGDSAHWIDLDLGAVAK